MQEVTFQKLSSFVAKWRAEMKNPTVPSNFNADLLRGSLREIEKAGVPEGLATYLVAVTEYLFRLKIVDAEEVEKIFIDIETGLKSIMDQRIAYHVVQALEPSILSTIKAEGRIPIAFNPFGKNAGLRFDVVVAGEESLIPHQEGPPTRIILKDLAPRKSGPLPWIAPWVAGSAINGLLANRGVSGTGLALNLVVALHGKSTLEEGDFRKREKSLKGNALSKFIKHYEDEYNWHIEMEKSWANQRLKPLTWEEFIFVQWEPDDDPMRLGHSSASFRHNEKLVFELFDSYDTSGRVKGNKTLKKGGKK